MEAHLNEDVLGVLDGNRADLQHRKASLLPHTKSHQYQERGGGGSVSSECNKERPRDKNIERGRSRVDMARINSCSLGDLHENRVRYGAVQKISEHILFFFFTQPSPVRGCCKVDSQPLPLAAT